MKSFPMSQLSSDWLPARKQEMLIGRDVSEVSTSGTFTQTIYRSINIQPPHWHIHTPGNPEMSTLILQGSFCWALSGSMGSNLTSSSLSTEVRWGASQVQSDLSRGHSSSVLAACFGSVSRLYRNCCSSCELRAPFWRRCSLRTSL